MMERVPRKSRRIAVVSQKGGVGKTTISLNLSLAMAEKGRRTLLVDTDPQGGIGHSLGKGDTELRGLVDLLMGAATAEQAVLQTKVRALSLLPRGRLDPIDVCEYERTLGQPGILAGVLDSLSPETDLCIIDTPSGLGMVTRAVLGVCDFVLIPLQTEALAARSVTQTLRLVEHLRRSENEDLRLLGIVPSMVDRTDETAATILAKVWTQVPAVLEAAIPRDPTFSRASEQGVPVSFLAGAVTREERRFQALAEETERIMAELGADESVDERRPQRALL